MAAENASERIITQLAGQLAKAASAVQAQAAAASSSAGGATSSADSGAVHDGSSTGTGGGGGAAGGGSVGSPAAAEVTVLKDEQALASTQQALAATTMRSPIDGTVGAVGLSAGQQATTSQSIVIIGHGTALVTLNVPLSQLGLIRVDQTVAITPTGSSSDLKGLVQSIGVLPNSSTSTTPTFPVVVAISHAPVLLATGSNAAATITLATAHHALTVPVSAVAGLTGGQGQVTIISAGTQKSTTVGIGAFGGGLAQVTRGLSAGEVVVLADPSQPLPSANLFGGRVGSLGGSGMGGIGGGRPSSGSAGTGSTGAAASRSGASRN